jgi:hypothetical protein
MKLKNVTLLSALAALSLAMATPVFAQSPAAMQGLNNIISTHPALQQNPRLLDNPGWLAQHPNAARYMADHPNLRREVRSGAFESNYGSWDPEHRSWHDAYWWHQNNPSWVYANHPDWGHNYGWYGNDYAAHPEWFHNPTYQNWAAAHPEWVARENAANSRYDTRVENRDQHFQNRENFLQNKENRIDTRIQNKEEHAGPREDQRLENRENRLNNDISHRETHTQTRENRFNQNHPH